MTDSRLAARLRRDIEGEVLFDAFSRGRYSTDASIYQVMPIGVVVPRHVDDVARALAIAREEGVSILPRGGGTSQVGQTVGEALVLDNSKFLRHVVRFDPADYRVTVQPGIVLDELNKFLRPHGLFFPVDVSTANRATIGGMAGNNSCGSRSIRYGNMVHNVHAIDALLASGERLHFGAVPADLTTFSASSTYRTLIERLRALHDRERREIEARFPRLLRRVGGYNIDTLSSEAHNMARLLVGSEGTLAYFNEIELDLKRIPAHRVLGVCHFAKFYAAMDMTQHIVKLNPTAVELVDRTMIDLARDIAVFRTTVDRLLKGEPDALLLVEFAGDERDEQVSRLRALDELLSDLGHPESVVEVIDPGLQRDIWEVRKAGLNIMMSMKGDGKPVSFIEDCAVPLEHLAEYTDRLTRVFEKYGTRGTWYAHASVGCLHVRPILNMKEDGAVKMRAIAEEAFAMVREYKGSHSGEHGDGLARSEWHERMFGRRLARAFEEVKDLFDPDGLLNPGKIVRAPKMDDRSLHRYMPGYHLGHIETALDWSEWGGFGQAIEMCNNNGACRKANPGVMCPSFRVSRDEQHLTRGRANTLRLAVSGQLGPDALIGDEMYETMDLCVSCKACKRECPTGVDMARMKIEFLHHYYQHHRLPLRQRLVAYLPRYASVAAHVGSVLNLRNTLPGLPWLGEKLLGFSRHRRLPRWSRDTFRFTSNVSIDNRKDRSVVLFVDTFTTYFEPENARAALAVLSAADYQVHAPIAASKRPLCCGRTFLSVGMVEEARAEAARTFAALRPYIEQRIPVVGLEPSCLLTLRDEFKALLPGSDSEMLARQALLFEEFLVREQETDKAKLRLRSICHDKALLHGHCHQKTFGAMPAIEKTIRLIPGLGLETIEAGCCGMAGAFGYEARHYDMSLKMGEQGVLPKARAMTPRAVIVADGFSCREQIRHGTGRDALHVVRLLASALPGTAPP